MTTPSTDVIHSTRLSGAYFLQSDVVNYLNQNTSINTYEICTKVHALDTYSFESSILVKKEEAQELIEKFVGNDKMFFREMECEVVTILFTRFGLTD